MKKKISDLNNNIFKKYNALPGTSYQELMKFWKGPSHPDIKLKSLVSQIEEIAFKLILQDKVEGIKIFEKFFSVAMDVSGHMPEIIAPREKWAEAIKSSDLMVLSYEIYDNMLDMSKNALSLEVEGMTLNLFCRDSAWNSIEEWKSNLIEKKAMIDIASITDEMKTYLFCVEVVEKFEEFEKNFVDLLWIKNFHLVEGGWSIVDNLYPRVIFIVCRNVFPYTARLYEVETRSMGEGESTYRNLCKEYDEWKRDDKEIPSILPAKSLKPNYER